jgi:hypothetical protein
VTTTKNAKVAFVASEVTNATGTVLEASSTLSAGERGQWGRVPRCLSLSLTHVGRTVESNQHVQCEDPTDEEAYLTRPLGETVRTNSIPRPLFHYPSRFPATNLHFLHC